MDTYRVLGINTDLEIDYYPWFDEYGFYAAVGIPTAVPPIRFSDAPRVPQRQPFLWQRDGQRKNTECNVYVK